MFNEVAYVWPRVGYPPLVTPFSQYVKNLSGGERRRVSHGTAALEYDLAKENLFNVLSNNYFDFENGVTALDLFAGTGSISIELVSRGCDRVISVEKDPQHLSFISQVMREVKTDKCFPIRADVFRFIDKCSEQFDFIFADPPYTLKDLESIPTRIFESGILKEDGLLVLEHGKENHFEDNPHFIERRVYGSVNFSFFKAMVPATEQ